MEFIFKKYRIIIIMNDFVIIVDKLYAVIT